MLKSSLARVVPRLAVWAAVVWLPAAAARGANLDVTDGLQLWLRADGGVTYDSAGVSLWEDQSSNGFDAVQSDDNRKPVFVPNAFDNGLPALRFTGSSTNSLDDRLDGPAGQALLSGSSGRTVFVVTRENVSTQANVSILTLNTTGGGANGTVYRVTPEVAVRVYGSTEYLNHPIDQEYRILAVRNPDGANTNNTSALLDGILLKPSAYTADQSLNTGTGGYRIGDSETNGGSSLTGDIAEILVYDRQLTEAETNSVGYYLENKYELKTSYVPPANNDNKVQVWLLGGQSNMRGHGDPSQVTDPTFQAPQGDVMHWHNQHNDSDDAYGWEQLTWGGGRTQTDEEGGFGPELSFGRTIADAFPDERIALIKHAIGGTNLYNQWNATTGGSVYLDFLETVHAALDDLTAKGYEYEIKGMLWMQGEADTGNAAGAAAYEENLTDLIAAIRAEFSTPDMVFVMGRIRGNGAYTDTVREAQVAVAEADPLAAWVDVDDLPLVTYDTIHLNTYSQLVFGERLADAYLALPEPGTLLLLAAGIPLLVKRKRA